MRLVYVCFLAAVLFVGAVSCDQSKIYNNSEPIAGETWHYDSAVAFSFEIEDTVNIHDMLLHIRNAKDYEYSNMWVFVTFEYPNGTEYTDTVECPLAFSDGKWIGSSGPGYVNNLVMFKKDMQFPVPGEYKVHIVHGMRDEHLEGIENIGLRVQRAV